MDIPLSMNYHNFKVKQSTVQIHAYCDLFEFLMYNFIVVEKLIASVFLVVDFLHANSLIWQTQPQKLQAEWGLLLVHKLHVACQTKSKVCTVAAIDNAHTDIIDECTDPVSNMISMSALLSLPGITASLGRFMAYWG